MDTNQLKVEIFPNVNDSPRLPTSQRPGNGSHIISKFNNLVDTVINQLESLKSQIEADRDDFDNLSLDVQLNVDNLNARIDSLNGQVSAVVNHPLIQEPYIHGNIVGSFTKQVTVPKHWAVLLNPNSAAYINLGEGLNSIASVIKTLFIENDYTYTYNLEINATFDPIRFYWAGYFASVTNDYNITPFDAAVTRNYYFGTGLNLEDADDNKVNFSLTSGLNKWLHIYNKTIVPVTIIGQSIGSFNVA